MLKLLDHIRFLDPQGQIREGRLLILDDRLAAVLNPGEDPGRALDLTVDLEGALVFPSLINSHDHLIDTFWPKFGPNPFPTWYDWTAAFKDTPVFRQMQRLSATDLYSLGMYRNALSGVGMVVDHFPREISNTFLGQPLVDLYEHFFLAHSVSSRRLEWGMGIQEEYRQSRGVLPFILHLGEGTSTEIGEEFETLGRLGAIGPNTVVVNGTSLTQHHLESLAKRKSSLVWCPESSANVLGAQPPIAAALDLGIPITLGTDSSIMGSVNLFSALRFTRAHSREHLGGRLTDWDLVQMVTRIPARIFQSEKTMGSIETGKKANLLIFEDSKGNPFESFFALNPRDILLTLHNGMPVFGQERFRSVCGVDYGEFSEVQVDGSPRIIWGKPLQLLERIENKLGEPKQFPFLPVVME